MNIWISKNIWHIRFNGRTYTRHTQKGMTDLVKLLSNDMAGGV
jgi:hypothetical protein